MSIRLRIILWHTLLLGIVVAVLAILVYTVVAEQMTNRLDTTLRERTADVRPEVVRSGGTGLLSSGGCLAEPGPPASVDFEGESLMVEVINVCGEVVITSSNLSEPIEIPQTALDDILAGETVYATVNLPQGRARLYGGPIAGISTRIRGFLLVATPLEPLTTDLFHLKLALFALGIGTVLLAAGIGWFLAAEALRPVDRMTRAARAIRDAADFSHQIPEPPQQDEIGRLARTFNEMLGRLGQAFTTQKQFLADASHELRTPLTVIRTNVDLLARGGTIDATECDEALQAVAREAERMGRLVDDLLALARSDAGQTPQRRRLALDALLLDVYHHFRALMGDVRLVMEDFEPVEIEGDPDQLKQLVSNLVDNAYRHTPAGGTVTLSLSRTDQWATLRVHDTCSGISAEHLPHIFERFYRGDSARSRHGGGAGLGLAISREIAEAHGGHITVESQVGSGSTFTVVLPCADRASSPSETGRQGDSSATAVPSAS